MLPSVLKTMGSPPLTRGKDSDAMSPAPRSTITPAYAGKRFPAVFIAKRFKDHPRLRGEKRLISCSSAHAMWITPAYAGKSLHQNNFSIFIGDHPRLRGEKSSFSAVVNASRGSPPLTRGKGIVLWTIISSFGITPAYAGKSYEGMPKRIEEKDHPRLRGEKPPISTAFYEVKGSPPLTRGKAEYIEREAVLDRITPAYAGKSSPPSRKMSSQQDHPRLRGEKITASSNRNSKIGSPPLTRGKGDCCAGDSFKSRITPAYAGKSTSAESRH